MEGGPPSGGPSAFSVCPSALSKSTACCRTPCQTLRFLAHARQTGRLSSHPYWSRGTCHPSAGSASSGGARIPVPALPSAPRRSSSRRAPPRRRGHTGLRDVLLVPVGQKSQGASPHLLSARHDLAANGMASPNELSYLRKARRCDEESGATSNNDRAKFGREGSHASI